MSYYLKPYIDNGSVLITQTVYHETTRKISDLIASLAKREKLSATVARYLTHNCLVRFFNMSKSTPVIHDASKYGDVTTMYATIWADGTKLDKRQTWAALKKCKLEDGPPKGNDLIILSTAAQLTTQCSIRLLTFDHDFILFSDEIRDAVCIQIENGWLIPN